MFGIKRRRVQKAIKLENEKQDNFMKQEEAFILANHLSSKLQNDGNKNRLIVINGGEISLCRYLNFSQILKSYMEFNIGVKYDIALAYGDEAYLVINATGKEIYTNDSLRDVKLVPVGSYWYKSTKDAMCKVRAVVIF